MNTREIAEQIDMAIQASHGIRVPIADVAFIQTVQSILDRHMEGKVLVPEEIRACVERLRLTEKQLSALHADVPSAVCGAAARTIESLAAQVVEPAKAATIAWGIQNDQGYWVGIWNDKAVAEAVLQKGQPSHGERIVALAEKP